MYKVLIDNCSQSFFKLMKLNLKNYFNFESTLVENLTEDLGEINEDYIGIISVDNEYSDNCQTINSYIKENEQKIVYAVVGKIKEYDNCNFQVSSEKEWPMIIRGISQFISENNIEIKSSNEEYFAIEPDILKSVNKCSSDIYIKIERKGANARYVKRIHSGETFDNEDIDRYVSKGVSEFYVLKQGQKNLVKALTVSLMSKLDNPDLEQTERLEVNAEAYSNTKALVQKYGLTPEVVDCSNSTVKSMEKIVEDEPDLFDLYEDLIAGDSSEYVYAKSQLTANMATQIVFGLNLDGKDDAISKLTYAAFFNDVYLNDWDLAKIRSQVELKEVNLDEDEQELVTMHAAKSLQLLEKYPQLPLGVGDIIREHHGTKIGKGFSDTLPQDLNQLSVVFIVAEEVATGFLLDELNDGDGDYEDILDQVYAKYNQSFARKCVNALREIIIDEDD